MKKGVPDKAKNSDTDADVCNIKDRIIPSPKAEMDHIDHISSIQGVEDITQCARDDECYWDSCRVDSCIYSNEQKDKEQSKKKQEKGKIIKDSPCSTDICGKCP